MKSCSSFQLLPDGTVLATSAMPTWRCWQDWRQKPLLQQHHASVNDILPVKGRNLLAAALQDDSSRRSEFRNPPQTSEECGTCSSGGSTCGASEVQSSFPEASPISSESGNSTGEVTLPVSMNEVSPSEAAAAGATRRKKHQSPTSTAVASKGGAVTLSGQDLVRDLKKTGVSALARASALARDMRPKQRR
eukprot:CAMPEP_0206531372 /NCGR_PEP_ID=MMETSP0325_2-20121206/3724_1 /ASSEMBLY_ACC=CAM_ASM_000347 /TAXON_ID=2866 /ORGANISM="Crypthecodinium cohnii, Strain Seligo" /LENGTH=190 /DNA_ID=CAMNT_0054027599 /DNA_START=276 /DNA_END=848 /DNA_ORIENTATION=+